MAELEQGARYEPASLDTLTCDELVVLATLMDAHMVSGAHTSLNADEAEFLREKLHQEITHRTVGPGYSWVGIVGGCSIVEHVREEYADC
jgi:hypothetical protein